MKAMAVIKLRPELVVLGFGSSVDSASRQNTFMCVGVIKSQIYFNLHSGKNKKQKYIMKLFFTNLLHYEIMYYSLVNT